MQKPTLILHSVLVDDDETTTTVSVTGDEYDTEFNIMWECKSEKNGVCVHGTYFVPM